MGGQDASFIYNEAPRMPMHIAGLAIYDPSTAKNGTVTFKGILDHIRSRLALVPSYRERMVRVPFDLDHPWWIVDPEFDLEFHVRHIALPYPGDWRQLCIQAARLHARELDLERPLWEMYVIEGLDNVEGVPPGSFAVLTKTHHAAIDGVSGAELTAVINDFSPDAEAPPATDLPAGEPLPSPYELIVRAGINTATQPQRFAEFVQRNMAAFPTLARPTFPPAPAPYQPPTAPRTRFSGTVTAHRVIENRSFDLDEVRGIKSAVSGATINDAVLAIVAGALRRYLEAKNELPTDPLVVMAPISIRSQEERGAMGNRVSAMMLPIPTNVADPVERLRIVHQTTQETKGMASAVPARTLTDFNQFIPWALAGLAARTAANFRLAETMAPAVNTVVTNVPGPQVPLYMAGAKLLKQFGMGPVTDGMGIMHPVFSYNGEIAISVTACREMMPDPAFYAECLQASFDDVAAATAPPRKHKATAATKEKAPAKAADKATAVNGDAGRADKPDEPAAGTKRAAAKRAAPATRKAAPTEAGPNTGAEA
jgi:WS/DGAT/MGAT family acyltransferase